MDNESKTLTLRTALKVQGEMVTSLTFRPPIGRDIREVGNPINMAGRELGIDDARMHAMIARLAGIPPSSVDMLSYTDWTGAVGVITGFLEEPGPISSIDTSIVRSTGAETSSES